MENINIQVLMKSTAYTEPKVKKAAKQENNNDFSQVINKKLSEKENNTKAAAENKVSEDSSVSEEPKIKGDKVEDVVQTEEPKLEENTNEQLNQLMQMLMSMGTATDTQDIDKLKQIISKLLLGSISGENKYDKGKTLNFKTADVNVLLNTKNNLQLQVEVLASQIAHKLSTDSDFRTQLISKVSGELQGASANDSVTLKEAIIKELSSLVKKGADNEDQTPAEDKEFETLSNIQPVEAKQSSETNEGYSEETKPRSPEADVKTVNKEDKLLKDMMSDEGTKNTKENISDKIANVVTRFQALGTDKPVTVEAQVTINRDNFNADFIKAVKFMDTNKIQELSVKIIPKDLGEIVIRLSMDNGVMKANITAANKETYNLLNSQLTAISNQLADANMNIQSFNLSLYNGDNFLFSGNGNDQGERKQQEKKAAQIHGIESDEAVAQVYGVEDSSINMLA